MVNTASIKVPVKPHSKRLRGITFACMALVLLIAVWQSAWGAPADVTNTSAKAAKKVAKKATSEKLDAAKQAYLEGLELAKLAQEKVDQGQLAEARTLWSQVSEKFQEARYTMPMPDNPLEYWGASFVEQAAFEMQAGNVREVERLQRQFAALELSPDWADFVYQYGVKSRRDAVQENDAQNLPAARSFWRKAAAEFKIALLGNPQFFDAAFNWANTLNEHAKVEANSGDLVTARALWSEASQRFEQALAIARNAQQAMPAKSHNASEAESEYESEDEKEEAIATEWEHTYRLHDVLQWWGMALADQVRSELRTGDLSAARSAALQADAVFQQAVAIKVYPNFDYAVVNWSNLLFDQAAFEAKAGHDDEAKRLQDKALALIAGYVENHPEFRAKFAYNVACVYALRGQAAQAVEQLEIARKGDELPSQAHMQKDHDLDPIRKSAEFKAWWKRYLVLGGS